MKSYIVIPARYESIRLPHKLLLDDTGKTLIQHTYEAACRAVLPSGVIVATDHDEIFNEVKSFGGHVVMTDPNAASGMDRVAEVAEGMSDVDIFVNVQGDEPEISGGSIDLVIQLLEEDSEADMATLATPIRDRKTLEDPNCVKVVIDNASLALYFSRSMIPYPREWDDSLLKKDMFLQHIGLYAYRRDMLHWLFIMPHGKYEDIERLEQLRVLEAGYTIIVDRIDVSSCSIDTLEDYRCFVERENERMEACLKK